MSESAKGRYSLSLVGIGSVYLTFSGRGINPAVEEAIACVMCVRSAEGVSKLCAVDFGGCMVVPSAGGAFRGRLRPRFGFGSVVGGRGWAWARGADGAGSGERLPGADTWWVLGGGAGMSQGGSLVEKVGKYRPCLFIAGRGTG